MGSNSPLESLPAELMWKLIEYTPKSVLKLRITSRQINKRVDEFVRLRSTDSPVENLELFKNSMNQFTINMRMTTAFNIVHYRIFRLRLIDLPDELRRSFKRDGACWVFLCELDIRKDHAFLLRHPVFGRKIEKVTISECWEAPKLAFVSKTLQGKEFEKLKVVSFVMSNTCLTFVRNAIDVSKVDRVSLTCGRFGDSLNPVAVLLEFSSLVSSLHLYQQHDAGVAAGARYLFGAHNVDWPQIIERMFTRKLDKLFIENISYPEYLMDTCSQYLRLQLPRVGKPIWFEAFRSRAYGITPLHSGNEYSVEDGCFMPCEDRNNGFNCNHFKTLKIKHVSREQEPRDF